MFIFDHTQVRTDATGGGRGQFWARQQNGASHQVLEERGEFVIS